MKWGLWLFLCLVMVTRPITATAESYAYLTKATAVKQRDGRKMETLSKGVTIAYSEERERKLWFSYKGRKCWIEEKNTIHGNSLVKFIKQNQDLFHSVVETITKVRVKDSIGGKSVYRIGKGTRFRLFGEEDGWYKVQLDGTFGWVKAQKCRKLCIVDVLKFPKVSGKTKGEKIVNYAKKWVGNPYVWGGTSLTSGADCSGFVQSVYKYFKIDLPRCSWQQATTGKPVDFAKMKPGDLIFYYRGSRIGHVTIYAGDGKCVQARGKNYGIVVTDWDYSQPAFARRVLS